MKNLAKHISVKITPQSRAIPGKNQVQNNAGGFVFTIDPWKRLQRFLVLGSEGGTYYVSEQKLTAENAAVVNECAALDATRTIDMLVSISESGRAPKNDAAILALAVLSANADNTVRRLALVSLPKVCRIGTHLFQFIQYVNELRGWGRGLRDAIASWYNDKTLNTLAWQVTKYRNRCGFTHRDALRLSHPKTTDYDRNQLYQWIVSGGTCGDIRHPDLHVLQGFTAANYATNVSTIVKLINDYGLVWEHVPTSLLNSPAVWEALLPNLKLNAIIRNLGKMTSVGLLKPLSGHTKHVCSLLTSGVLLNNAKLHPMSILLALDTYRQGHGFRGQLTWTPVPQIVSALNEAFYSAFNAVVPTNKNHLLAVDVSGSMEWATNCLAGTRITARQAAACMSLVTARAEPNSHVLGFGHELTDLGIHSGSTLESVIETMKRLPMQRTNCALPMLYAKENKLDVDAFVVYTDNETWFGDIHPCQALNQYRQASGRDAKLIVVGLTATQFSIADPNDAGMMDVVGFDAACPAIMADFVRE